ncbi:2-hydroxy-3-keto-5-methylthiopentenyl-1-phosphate phosphatase [Robertmurraya korlensis]|uniref:2-hydroxy-3-keto-5-methylthiopentenyl-1- phosphate phosphatase n=1 Tax=Robertmurraya korlensis TaxID=519977 RepID=UPI00082562EC|nr:2-hydroxy-3-keto-5-methylthiopentenyl-1-phosphate phosphatase [Robertmurraya korlensis]
MSKKIAVFCDFDGTITEKDNIIAIMKKFAPPEWELLKDDILSERMSIREGVGRLFSLLPSSKKEEIITYAIENVKIREGFADFVKFLKEQNIPLYIVSGGIDFFVHPILETYGPFAGVYCNVADFSGEYINILWPNACDEQCENDCGCCKPSIIRSLKEDFYKVVIGDSVTDLQAAKQADLVIARELLLEKSEEYGLNYREFVTFYDVIKHMSQVEELIG